MIHDRNAVHCIRTSILFNTIIMVSIGTMVGKKVPEKKLYFYIKKNMSLNRSQ